MHFFTTGSVPRERPPGASPGSTAPLERRPLDGLGQVMLALPFALVGGVLFMWLAGYNWSVASVIGFIALAGVAAETGVVMLVFLGIAWRDLVARGPVTPRDLYQAVMDGAVERLRPIMMTNLTIIFGLLPILWSAGTGASVMKRIAAPMVGGMISATLLTLLVIPAMYSLWREWGLRREVEPAPTMSAATPPSTLRADALRFSTVDASVASLPRYSTVGAAPLPFRWSGRRFPAPRKASAASVRKARAQRGAEKRRPQADASTVGPVRREAPSQVETFVASY